jgi:hypothetical protein
VFIDNPAALWRWSKDADRILRYLHAHGDGGERFVDAVARASGGEARDLPSKHSPPCRESGPTPTTDIAGEAQETNDLRRDNLLPSTVNKNLGVCDVFLDKNENMEFI